MVGWERHGSISVVARQVVAVGGREPSTATVVSRPRRRHDVEQQFGDDVRTAVVAGVGGAIDLHHTG